MLGKKLLCNPPAERVAGSGDPMVQGLFEGAGDFAASQVGKIDPVVLNTYLTDVLAAEATYLEARAACCAAAVEAMSKANDTLLSSL